MLPTSEIPKAPPQVEAETMGPPHEPSEGQAWVSAGPGGRPRGRPIRVRPQLMPSASSSSAIYGCGCNSCGCNLKLSEVRSGSFNVDLGPALGPKGPEIGPGSTPTDPDRTSHNFKLHPHELQQHP
jgi:hypothetical protein